jgi:hypothetical protein
MSPASNIIKTMKEWLSEKARALLEYCLDNDRVCPKREYWNQLWVITTQAKTFISCLNTVTSPVLSEKSTDQDKIQRSARLRIYIECADRNNLIDQMDDFIRSIPEREWHHFYEE